MREAQGAPHDAFDASDVHTRFGKKSRSVVNHHNIPVHWRIRCYERTAKPFAPPPTGLVARLSPSLEEVPKAVRVARGRLPALAIFDLLARAETTFVPPMELKEALLGNLALDRALVEMPIIAVGVVCDARYELAQHTPGVRAARVSRRKIKRSRRSTSTPTALTRARERALLNFVRMTVVDVDVDDATWEAARDAFSEREIVELLLVSGFYRTMCGIMRTARLPIEPAMS